MLFVGNFFFAGARLFFRSLEAAIFLFSRVARIPEGSLVLPAIETEKRITLGAELQDGSFLRGQCEISHPLTRTGTDYVPLGCCCDGMVKLSCTAPQMISLCDKTLLKLKQDGVRRVLEDRRKEPPVLGNDMEERVL